MVVRRLYSGNVIVNDYVVPAVKCRDIRIKTPDDHWYISTFSSWDYVIIDHNIARIKTPNDHWYRDIPMVVPRLYSGNVIVNDYVVPAVKCRDIPMAVRRLYSGNVISNDYVDYVIIDYNIARIKTPDDHWYIATFYSQDYVIMIITLPE
jgi:hypothetical protein